eukprot:TRINITY_DN197_c0_g1_i10.p2 TRINITY_DN197_c0_g1~~TRINITY_DN197_c0_g1_i10.p2  ORF type:complete len:149 (+),score=27.29 TRINITY_DN197_c0_g1_i10:172-618(+)
MKLFLTVVLASMLMMKTAEGADGDVGAACKAADPKCTDANAECNSDPICACKSGYTASTATPPECKVNAGGACTENAACFDGTCSDSRKKCGKAIDADCTANVNCASGNCMLTETDSGSTQKCADAGAAGVVTSVLLMVATLMTSRIL